MTTTTTDDAVVALAADDDAERRRKQAILRAVGLENVPPEQRELALAIANRYDLDLMLKHLVLVEGRPYITRDALLWVAHRSGHFDGISTTEPSIKEFPNLGQCWYAEATVYRDDMTHPFVYGGRYPVAGQNRKYGPEMAIKVAECMALRRAFNVSAATVEERWEQGEEEATAGAEPTLPRTLPQLVAERAATIAQGGPQPAATPVPAPDAPNTTATDLGALPEPLFADLVPEMPTADPEPPTFTEQMGKAQAKAAAQKAPKPPVVPPVQIMPTLAPPSTEMELDQCDSMSPYTEGAQCRLYLGHKGAHRSSPQESWTTPPAVIHD